MNARFEHNDPADPAMEEVKCVEGNAQERDERVVTGGEDEEHDHVYDGKVTGAAADFCYEGSVGVTVVVEEAAVGYITGEVGE